MEVIPDWPCRFERRRRHWFWLSLSPSGCRQGSSQCTQAWEGPCLAGRAVINTCHFCLVWPDLCTPSMHVCTHAAKQKLPEHAHEYKTVNVKMHIIDNKELCTQHILSDGHTYSHTHEHTVTARSDGAFRPRHQSLLWGQTTRPRSTPSNPSDPLQTLCSAEPWGDGSR